MNDRTNGRSMTRRTAALSLVALGWLSATADVSAQDCNRNGIEDTVDLANELSVDCNGNGVPDECDLEETVHFESEAIAAGTHNGFFDVTLADLDDDGALDLVTVGRGDRLEVRAGSGDGSFQDPERFLLARAGPVRVLARDFDGDGQIDIATANAVGRDVVVLMGIEGGMLDAGSQSYNLNSVPSDLEAGDFDGDGSLDLVTCSEEESSFAVLLGRGDGSFDDPVVADSLGVSSPRSIVSGDFDGDGDLDLITVSNPRNIRMLVGNGDGSFAGNVLVFTPRCPNPFGLVAADFDENGELDFAVTSLGANDVTVFLGEGGGEFGYSRMYRVGAEPRSIVSGDFDGDGVLDLATADRDGASISLLLGDGEGMGGFENAFTYSTPDGPDALAAGDIDGDGRIDLATAHDAEQSLSVYRNRRVAATSHDCNRNGTPDECDIDSLSSEDEDEDGIPDECGARFRRSDTDGNGDIDISDPIFLLRHLFLERGLRIPCDDAADSNDDGSTGLDDAVFTLGYLFLGATPPAAPFPGCGVDPSTDRLACTDAVGCE